VVLRYDSLCFAQRGKPPLDLKVFISGKAFYNSAFFYKQLEVTRLVFALIGNVFHSRREIDTAGGKPIMLYNTLGTRLGTSIIPIIHVSHHVWKTQNRGDSYDNQSQRDKERLSHRLSPFRFADQKE
jgi:hypothetical protein